jgi:hypothetical protein
MGQRLTAKNRLTFGEEKGPPDALQLKAGPLDLVFETGFLRYLKIGENDVIRMMYFAVRDHNWDTIEGDIRDLDIRQEKNRFMISYSSVHQKDPVDISFDCSIKGNEKGHITFSILGRAGTSFRKNRIGFCVLHPISGCKGKNCIVEDQNGNLKILVFPVEISPRQPFRNIKSMKWEVNDHYQARIEFYGDVFETEDQRNWTDASYKTYCTPLDIPFPVVIKAGDTIHQQVELEMIPLKGSPVRENIGKKKLTYLIEEETSFVLPGLGCGASTLYDQLDKDSHERIQALQLDHIRWDLELGKKPEMQQNRHIQQELNSLGTAAFLALFFGQDPEKEYREWAEAIRKYPFPVRYLLLFSATRKTTPESLINSLVNRIRQDFPDTWLGAGTNAYFAELNRERFDPRLLDFISYSINPQVHAFDHASLTETLEAQGQTVMSARSISAGKDIVVSPVTFKPRFNPNATGESAPPPPGELPSQVDVRQMSLYGACWMLISLKYLAETGVRAITYFETTGWKGLMQGPQPPPLPSLFRSEQGDFFPVYQIFRMMRGLKEGRIFRSVSSHPLVFDGITIRHHGIHHIFLVNFSRVNQKIYIQDKRGPFLVRSLNAENIRPFIKGKKSLDEINTVQMEQIELESCSIQWINMKNELDGS